MISLGRGLTPSDICGEMASVTNVLGERVLAWTNVGRERVDVAGWDGGRQCRVNLNR